MEYTKGEWHYNKALGRIFARIEKPTKQEFLAEVAIISNDDTQESEANAHLIAAAPLLYEACKRAHRELLHAQWEDGLDQIEEALAKAKGG